MKGTLIMDDSSELQTDRTHCVICTLPVVFVGKTPTIHPGEIYSQAGKDEFRISGICEYCFDEITREAPDFYE